MKKRKENILNRLKNFTIIYVAILLISLTLISASKYTGKVEVQTSVGIARPILELIIDDENVSKLSPINSISIPIKINNYNDKNEINDIKLKYNILFSFEGNNEIPITIELFKINEDQSKTKVTLDDSLKSEQLIANAGKAETYNYELMIKWEGNDASYIYQNITKTLKIDVEVEQVKV